MNKYLPNISIKSLRKGLLLVFALVLVGGAKAQDIQFSQFYTAALYQNPAFAGAMHAPRAMAHQRLQWNRIAGQFNTSMASFDTYFSKYNSGVGLMVLQDYQETISSTEARLQYSYELHISPKLTARPALDLGYINRSIDYTKLLFPSDFDNTQQIGSGSNYGADKKGFFDVGAGILLYTDRLWTGFSAGHMNQPNQAMYGQISRLPFKGTFTGGYKFYLQKGVDHDYNGDFRPEFTITPTFQYKSQGKSDQLDLGLYGMYGNFLVGLWYRGLPMIKEYDRIQNNESMIASAGYRWGMLTFNYSYDFTVSTLSKSKTGGAHEFNITFIAKQSKKHRFMKRLPCPDFYRHLQSE